MKKNHKILLGVALLGIGGYMYMKSKQPKKTAGFATSGDSCTKNCERMFQSCVKSQGNSPYTYGNTSCQDMLRNCRASCFVSASSF